MIPVLSAKEAQKDNGTTNPLTVCSVFPVIESTKNVREWKMYFCYNSILKQIGNSMIINKYKDFNFFGIGKLK